MKKKLKKLNPTFRFSVSQDKRSGKLFDADKEIATVFFWDDEGLEAFQQILDASTWKPVRK